MATVNEWGPLAPLLELLTREDHVADGDKDRKQSDAVLARLLSSEELSTAIQTASLEQLDLALAHDALAVERKPLCFLSLLSTKSAKLDAWASRKGVDEKAAQRHAAARLATQLAHFFSQVAVSVAAKELKRVSQLAGQYVGIAVDLRQAIKAVYPLKSFLRRFHGHGHTAVTAVHGHFMYLCLQAKCYSAAAEILDQPLFEVHAQANVSAVDFLSYAYYGGVLFLGQKKYQQAIELFVSAVTAPAVALSAFVVDAFKKLVLASLILHGEVPSLPKYTPFVVSRHLEIHCGPYNELARAFGDLQKTATVAQHHAAVFTKDGNFGLVKQVVDALTQRKLLQLPRTYVTLALRDMAAAVATGDQQDEAVAEKLLLQLIARGDMKAVIDQQKQMVTFVLDQQDDDGEASEAEQAQVMRTLQREMDKMLRVAAQLRAMDTDVVTSAKFQQRTHKEKERRSRGGGGAAAAQSQGDDMRGALLGQLGGVSGGFDDMME